MHLLLLEEEAPAWCAGDLSFHVSSLGLSWAGLLSDHRIHSLSVSSLCSHAAAENLPCPFSGSRL